METLLLLGLIGITVIVTQSKIFEPIRKLVDSIHSFLGGMISCAMCAGFWVGLFGYNIYGLLIVGDGISTIFWGFLFGGIISLLSWVVVELMDFLGTLKDYVSFKSEEVNIEMDKQTILK